MDSSYYIEYYTLERNHWWFKARLDILRAQVAALKLSSDSKILNIGIATGASSVMLQEFGKVKSSEYDQTCFEFVKQKLPQLDIEQGSILELPYTDNTYDLVSAFDVIEHVEDDANAVSEMLRVCKPGGYVAVTVPAYNFLWSHHDDVNHHYRRYTKSNLKKLFKTGGNIVFSSYFNFYLFAPIAGFRLFSKLVPKNFMRNKNEAGSDFSIYQPGFTQQLFYKLMRSENFFLKQKIGLPVGVSILLFLRKN
ncbi:MAG: class I SAM-dependent methyltransferase [Bacteroidota bacterium]